VKRCIDLVLGTSLAVLALPVITLLAVVGAMVWRANPFFVQERIGRGGAPYRVWKLRSLPVAAPAYADKYALGSVPIPPYGRLLRRLHLDELPQLFHAVSGRMSLVGPRPEMAFLHEQMPTEFAAERVSVRPGITGLWQVSPALAGLILEAPEYDRAYIAAQSVRLDTWILFRTALKAVGAEPVALHEVPAWALDLDDVPQSAKPRSWQQVPVHAFEGRSEGVA
jgi:lipopolysaccharide/colanic/teichoic acid biosynthesis glycosyltransferase